MSNIRINALANTASSSASDDYFPIDGAANNTRKLSAYSPTFGGNLTVSGTTASTSYSTGALVVSGGAGVGGRIYSGQEIIASQTGEVPYPIFTANIGRGDQTCFLATSTANGANNYNLINVVMDSGGTPRSMQMGVQYDGTTPRAKITSTLPIYIGSGDVSAISTTESTSSTTGAITTSGGLGVAKNINAGGNLKVAGTGASSVAGSFAANGQTSVGNWGFGIGSLGSGAFYISTNSSAGTPEAAQLYLGESNFNSSGFWNKAPGIGAMYDSASFVSGALAFFSYKSAARNEGFRLNSNSNVLIGTTTDSSNGKLQLASSTSSSGGIGFGTDVPLYRSAANILNLGDATSKFVFKVFGGISADQAPVLSLFRNGQREGFIAQGINSGSLWIGNTGGLANYNDATLAAGAGISLDSSNNATFAGNVTVSSGKALKLGNAYTAGAPTATGYVTIQDSAGNTYKVLVGT